VWQNILLTIVSVTIPAAVTYGLKIMGDYLSHKTHNANVQHALQVASEIVSDTVAQTAQTFVDRLKGTSDWNADAMKQAFDQSKSKAMSLISDKTQEIIEQETGNFQAWLQSKIEASVAEK